MNLSLPVIAFDIVSDIYIFKRFWKNQVFSKICDIYDPDGDVPRSLSYGVYIS